MKIRITKRLPMADQFQPPVGSVHEVVETRDYREYGTKAFCIHYNDWKICVLPEECEVIEP